MINDRLSRRQFGAVSLLAMLTGSQIFPGNSPPQDEDFIAFGDEDDFHDLLDDGWEYDGSLNEEESDLDEWPSESPFCSLSKGGQNIILAREEAFVAAWIAAHDECAAAPPPDKDGRIAVFRKHLYGEAG